MVERTERNRYDVGRGPQAASRESGRREQLREVCVEGLPQLDPSAIVRVTPGGDRLVIVIGKTISTYAVLVERTRAVARRIAGATLEGRTCDLALAPDGVPFVLVSGDMPCDGVSIGVVQVDGDRIKTLASLDVLPTAIAATRRYLALVVPGSLLESTQLLVLRRRDGGVVRREPLATARVRLRAGPGDELLIGEQGGRMRRVDAAPRTQECVPSGGDRPRPDCLREPPDTQELPCACPPCGRPPQPDHRAARAAARPHTAIRTGNACPVATAIPEAAS